MPSYQDSYERPVQLGSQINQGGEGKICRIVGDQSRVAKIWRVPNRERAIKLIATIKNTPVPVSARQNIRYCWPQDVLTDGKNIVGYIMPAVDTNEFRQSQEFFNETLRKDTEKKLGVTITEKTLVTTARDLCAAVAEIHAAGHVIGDVNEKNVLINSDGTIRIVDIDAIQIYDPETSETHQCTVGRDEYTPPRLQGQSFNLIDRTIDDDCFGLAVMIFKLTMGGRHPFTSRLSRDDDTAITGIGEKIKNEYFPYNQDGTVPEQYKVAVDEYKQAWDNSRDQIRTLFLQTFDPFETRNRPRPTATEWIDELDREIELIEQGRRKPAKPTRTSSPQISGNRTNQGTRVSKTTASTKSPYPNPPPNYGKPSTPASSYSASAPELERISAIVLIVSTVVAVVLIGLTASPRIPQDLTTRPILLSLAIAGISLVILTKTSKQLPKRLGEELRNTATFFAKAVTVRFQATARIPNQKTRLIVRTMPLAIITGTLIFLFWPSFFTVPPDQHTASPAEAQTSTQIPNSPDNLAPLSDPVPSIPLDNASQDQHLSSLATEYAHCNGAYSNQEAQARAQAMAQVIASSTTNIDEIRRFVHKECPPIPVNNAPTEQPTPQPTTTRALFHQTLPAVLPSTDQFSTPNPTAIPDVPIPTVTPAPSPTPSPYHLSTSLKPSDVQQLYDADGGLVSSQNYEIAACYYDPHNAGTPRKWKLFTQPDQSLLEPVFAIHFTEPINLQHGLCYEFNVSYMGPTEWRVCASQPYGGNCDHNSSDFLWEREIPAFRGKQDSATYVWTPDPDHR